MRSVRGWWRRLWAARPSEASPTPPPASLPAPEGGVPPAPSPAQGYFTRARWAEKDYHTKARSPAAPPRDTDG